MVRCTHVVWAGPINISDLFSIAYWRRWWDSFPDDPLSLNGFRPDSEPPETARSSRNLSIRYKTGQRILTRFLPGTDCSCQRHRHGERPVHRRR